MYSNELVCGAIAYINKKINEKITIDDISSKLFINRAYLMRLFKKEIGITIFDYINMIRIYNSLNIIKQKNTLLSKAGYDNGFSSLEYFSETFSKIIGVSPTKYRKFINNRYSLTDEEINIIVNNLIILNKLNEFIKKYLNNREIKGAIKKISIFK